MNHCECGGGGGEEEREVESNHQIILIRLAFEITENYHAKISGFF